jgi:hypothetical protein
MIWITIVIFLPFLLLVSVVKSIQFRKEKSSKQFKGYMIANVVLLLAIAFVAIVYYRMSQIQC